MSRLLCELIAASSQGGEETGSGPPLRAPSPWGCARRGRTKGVSSLLPSGSERDRRSSVVRTPPSPQLRALMAAGNSLAPRLRRGCSCHSPTLRPWITSPGALERRWWVSSWRGLEPGARRVRRGPFSLWRGLDCVRCLLQAGHHLFGSDFGHKKGRLVGRPRKRFGLHHGVTVRASLRGRRRA